LEAEAELDELTGAGYRDDLRGAAVQDHPLAARRVVLGELRDAVEQLGAALVVEVLRRQLLELAGEPVADVVGERLEHVAVEERRDRHVAGDGAGHTITAQRKPEKI
jgi:hypothetical protein